MPIRPHEVDVKRRAGWLPEQDDLESWLAGHRERVEAKRGEVVLHPALKEFQALIETDPVVRMYLDQMIAQVPSTKDYSKRHVESVEQLLLMINEVLALAPEFGEGAVTLPLNA
ncbi:MAG: phophatidylserine decarboxylase associated domain-containing protein, partial [Solirubrobacterales bacterium]|nr:phophatidylserine decarboxylase associated domain-containing protein [Solirubrobacterales bacterium]